MIQALLDATPAGFPCVIPPGVYDVPEHTSFTVPRSMSIIGTDATVNVVDSNGQRSAAVPTAPLFNANGLPDGSRLEVRDLTINGPDCSAWDQTTSTNTGAISWELYRTWNGTLIIDNVTVTGGYSTAVRRSGGGRFEVHNSTLEAWVNPLVFFEGHGGHGSMLVRNCTLRSPGRTKFSSIAAYIHPHLDVTWDNVVCEGFERFAIYLNGSPQSTGHHTFVDVTATDCALIQTGSSSETTLVRCVEQGELGNGGSVFKGPVLSVGSRWSANKPIQLLAGNTPDRRFVGDLFDGSNYWIAAGGTSAGTITAVGCTYNLGARASALQVTNRSTVAAEFTSCEFTGSPRWTVNVEGGSVRFVDMAVPQPVRVVAPGVMLP